MEDFKANIYIYLKYKTKDIKNNKIINKTSNTTPAFDDDQELSKKLLNSIYVALKGDIQSTPDFDTKISLSIKDDKLELCLSGHNISKFRASVISFLRLTDVAYSTILVDSR